MWPDLQLESEEQDVCSAGAVVVVMAVVVVVGVDTELQSWYGQKPDRISKIKKIVNPRDAVPVFIQESD